MLFALPVIMPADSAGFVDYEQLNLITTELDASGKVDIQKVGAKLVSFDPNTLYAFFKTLDTPSGDMIKTLCTEMCSMFLRPVIHDGRICSFYIDIK